MEWLKYIGVSTKRGEELTAGRFGEGFKIASLCVYRDYNISIHMESLDWKLDVVKVQGNIDGQNVEFLGYDMKKRSYEDNSILLLGNIEQKNKSGCKRNGQKGRKGVCFYAAAGENPLCTIDFL